MEVASPIAHLQPPSSSRHSRCSPMLAESHHKRGALAAAEEERSTKRRRFVMDVDALSEHFSSHSPFFKNNTTTNGTAAPSLTTSVAASVAAPATLKRSRACESRSRSPPTARSADDYRVLQEQSALMESLQKDKSGLEASLRALQTDHQRVVKENGILRKAVLIQQERQTATETELKAVQEQADERIRSLEQIIMSLRYHLQQQQRVVGNDFMRQTPPDVY